MLHCVLIGINNYQDGFISNLTFAREDAEEFADLLKNRIHPSEIKVHLLLDHNATKRNVLVKLGEELIRDVDKDDNIIIHFSGHGSPETNSSPDKTSRYLIMHDTEYDNIFTTGIDMELELKRIFERISLREPKSIIMFLDSCFSGGAGGRTFEGKNLKKQNNYRHLKPISLKELNVGEGRIMLSACNDDQVASENSYLKHGVFTYFLLESIKEKPTEATSSISIYELFDKIQKKVRDYTNDDQTPVFNGRGSYFDFPLLGI